MFKFTKKKKNQNRILQKASDLRLVSYKHGSMLIIREINSQNKLCTVNFKIFEKTQKQPKKIENKALLFE